ncbi:hypothetical protein SLEP1_g38692 [Rubroshorea leprosula]|uniref:Uncharacterized protein n=1 Tax=Rubroshorea leprosula TaxID=152421 RepID=A0AAV5KY13_9ROSI|nr:hypothetical protein SLEP1_g38692 [Rubroshorea leprosula]
MVVKLTNENKEHHAFVANGASQMEGNKDAAVTMGPTEVEMNQPPTENVNKDAILPALMDTQLVDVPLSLEFGGVKRAKGRGKVAKGGKGK